MTEHRYLVFRFAGILVREREFCVVKDGEVLPVEPKAFRVLLFLLRNPLRLIKKDELLDAVWNDCSVSENSLTRSIALLRRLLGDHPREPRYIATVPTIGYRFLCQVEVIEEDYVDVGMVPPSRWDENAPILPSGRGAPANPAKQEDASSFNWKQPAPRRMLLAGSLAAAFLLLAAASILPFVIRSRSVSGHARPAPAAWPRMRTVPLTNLSGSVRDPALSPDGKEIAFTWNGESPAGGDLYVQMVGGQKPLRLTHSKSGFVCCADWSPDGGEIAFGRCDDTGGAVYVVPALGGTERRLTDVPCPFGDAGHPKWTSDAKSLLVVDRCAPSGPSGVVVFSLETGAKRCLSMPPPHGDPGDLFPSLSPDGKTVAFLRSTTVGARELYTVPIGGGEARQITQEGTAGFDLMWSSDGHRIVFHSSRSGLLRVWQVDAAGGAVRPETVYPGTGSLSRDGRRLAYIESPNILGRSLAIWKISLSSAGGRIVARQGVHIGDGGHTAPKQSPDGSQMVFESCRTGTCQIWRSDSDGGNPMQLTFFDSGFPGSPRWSPDGKWVVFDHHPDRHSQIYLIDSEGRNLHRLTSGNNVNVVPSWSRDGTGVYFASNRAGSWQVWKRDLMTGRETQVTRHGGFAAIESYDGKTLYYSRFDGTGIWNMPASGGEELRITDTLHIGYWGYFDVTEHGIYFLDADVAPRSSIMYYNFQSKLLKPVAALGEDPVPWSANLGSSRDGRTLFIAQGVQHNFITLAENFQ